MSEVQSRPMCAICLDDSNDQENGQSVETPCHHWFHTECCLQAILQNPTCPMCRAEIPDNWPFLQQMLPVRNLRRYLQTMPHRIRYWSRVEDDLEEPPEVGPMLPSHQRWYNMDILEEVATRPLPWSPVWVHDRLVEMRIRFQIASEVPLGKWDIVRCENRALRGMFPEWLSLIHI